MSSHFLDGSPLLFWFLVVPGTVGLIVLVVLVAVVRRGVRARREEAAARRYLDDGGRGTTPNPDENNPNDPA